jgi:hypothetical protein
VVRDTCLSPTKSYCYCSLFISCFLGNLYLQSSEQWSFFYSKQTSGTNLYIGNKQVQLKTTHQSKEKLLKNALKDRLDYMVTQRWKNVENKTKVDAIERLLSNNIMRLRAWHILIRNHMERIFQRNTLY